MTKKTTVTVAREVVHDENVTSEREKTLALRVITDDAIKRKLHRRVRELENGLVRACDLAIDAADVIDDEALVDPDDEESEDFRRDIAEIRALVKRPMAKRHVIRQQAIEAHEADKAPTVSAEGFCPFSVPFGDGTQKCTCHGVATKGESR